MENRPGVLDGLLNIVIRLKLWLNTISIGKLYWYRNPYRIAIG